MTDEVVHDDPHTEYLAELAKLDKIRELPEAVYPYIDVVIWLALFAGLTRWSTLTWWWCLGILTIILIVVKVSCASHTKRLTSRYYEVGKKYLPLSAPEVFRHGRYKLSITDRTKAKVASLQELFFVDLRVLALSKGKFGWSSTEVAVGSFEEVQLFAHAVRAAKRSS